MARPKKEWDNENLKKQVEALLFSSGKRMHVNDLSKICRVDDVDLLKSLLSELKSEYESRSSSLMIVDEDNCNVWKFAVKEKHLPVVKKVVADTELSKSIMETLAVIAYKAPVKQSEVIDVRTNKAYDHISELESMGYISREKFGRTRLIKLSQRFFDYFDIPPDKLKDKLEKYETINDEIKDKEEEFEEKTQKMKMLRKEESEKDKKIESAVEDLEPIVEVEETEVEISKVPENIEEKEERSEEIEKKNDETELNEENKE